MKGIILAGGSGTRLYTLSTLIFIDLGAFLEYISGYQRLTLCASPVRFFYRIQTCHK
jgi:hypothetical protein